MLEAPAPTHTTTHLKREFNLEGRKMELVKDQKAKSLAEVLSGSPVLQDFVPNSEAKTSESKKFPDSYSYLLFHHLISCISI